mgnify:CR=1 FL=1
MECFDRDPDPVVKIELQIRIRVFTGIPEQENPDPDPTLKQNRKWIHWLQSSGFLVLAAILKLFRSPQFTSARIYPETFADLMVQSIITELTAFILMAAYGRTDLRT